MLSRDIQPKRKELINLDVMSSDQVFYKNNAGKYKLKDDLEVFGKVEIGSTAFIKNTNKLGNSSRYVDDVYNLPKKTKNEIVRKFELENRKVVYLVKRKK